MVRTSNLKAETYSSKWGIKKSDLKEIRRLYFDLNLIDTIHFNHDGSLLFYDDMGNLLPFIIPCSKITADGKRVYVEILTKEEFQGIVKLLEAMGMTFKVSKKNEDIILKRTGVKRIHNRHSGKHLK